MSNILEFSYLNDFFLNIGAVPSPSKVHGFLVGKLCGEQQYTAEAWREDLIKLMELEYLPPAEAEMEQLISLKTSAEKSLDDDQRSFIPIWPDDEASLHRRTAETSLWCEGFLEGLSASGLANNALKNTEEAEETLRSIAQISQMQTEFEDEDEDLEEAEKSLVALQEFVRTAVLNVYLGKSAASGETVDEDSNHTIH